jgi:hypothetical protein
MNRIVGALLAVVFTLAVMARTVAGTLSVSVALIPAGTSVDRTGEGIADRVQMLLERQSLDRKANHGSS